MARLKSFGSKLAAVPTRLKALPKLAEPFYLSGAWRTLIDDIKRERGAWCERCGSTRRVIGDHIVERKDGGADLDPENVELLCHRCHQGKTAKARAKRASGPIR